MTSIHDHFQRILRKERRKCAHVHQACRATERAMLAAFEMGLDVQAGRKSWPSAAEAEVKRHG